MTQYAIIWIPDGADASHARPEPRASIDYRIEPSSAERRLILFRMRRPIGVGRWLLIVIATVGTGSRRVQRDDVASAARELRSTDCRMAMRF